MALKNLDCALHMLTTPRCMRGKGTNNRESTPKACRIGAMNKKRSHNILNRGQLPRHAPRRVQVGFNSVGPFTPFCGNPLSNREATPTDQRAQPRGNTFGRNNHCKHTSVFARLLLVSTTRGNTPHDAPLAFDGS